MEGFIITTKDQLTIRFRYYSGEAPISAKAFHAVLPFRRSLYHARTSGQEFWIANAFDFDIVQENASVFTLPGEVVLGPMKPLRTKTAGGIGIYYGEGKGLDAANIFARAFEEDMDQLRALGERIWKNGQEELLFESLDSANAMLP